MVQDESPIVKEIRRIALRERDAWEHVERPSTEQNQKSIRWRCRHVMQELLDLAGTDFYAYRKAKSFELHDLVKTLCKIEYGPTTRKNMRLTFRGLDYGLNVPYYHQAFMFYPGPRRKPRNKDEYYEECTEQERGEGLFKE